MWDTRTRHLTALKSEFKSLSESLDRAFELLDRVIDAFSDTLARKPEEHVDYLIICGCTVTKAKNLALGVFSLMLDGLGQEAGAIGRPLVECIEKLEYYVQDPSRADAMISSKAPRHGALARLIERPQQQLRNYFSDHASHVAYTIDAMRHLVNWSSPQEGLFRRDQPFALRTLEGNLRALRSVTCGLCVAGWNCLVVGGDGPDQLGREIVAFREALVESEGASD